MKAVNKTDNLNDAIVVLKKQQEKELQLLKEQFQITYESLKPINLIKNTVNEFLETPELKNNTVNNVIGISTGYIARKVILGATRNPLTKILGTFLQLVITNVVAKHSEGIKSAGESIVRRIFENRKKRKSEFHQNGNK